MHNYDQTICLKFHRVVPLLAEYRITMIKIIVPTSYLLHDAN